ncbi:MAG: hypothetical protein GYA24_09920 [Candidatus Lokiarchaeota archaeon]|nr:hypothetical protein [Candidatus Lokiarchaeota archaeon]
MSTLPLPGKDLVQAPTSIEPSFTRVDVGSSRAQHQHLFAGTLSLAIMQAVMGVFMILASRFLSMLPLNTPGIYETIGRFQHVLGLRYGVSMAFFGLAVFTLVTAFVYKADPSSPKRRLMARILAITIQPWISLAILVVAAIWIVQAFDPSGDVARVLARLYSLDVDDAVDRAHYLYILGGLPNLELLFFAIGNFMLLPFSFYTSAMILQDTRSTVRTGAEFSDDYEQRHRQYVAKGLFNGGIVALLIGAALYGIGFILGYGLDVTWPTFDLANYSMFLHVYPWFPVAFGITCMVTSMAYYWRPGVMISRVLAWYSALVLMLVPIIGWFFGINLMMHLRETGKALEKRALQKQFRSGFCIAACSIIVPLVVFLLI